MGTDSRDPTRILIIDDHPVLRRGLRSLIEGEPDLEVCGEAGTHSEGLDAIESLRPDVAVIDLALGGADGLDLVKITRSRWPAVRMLVISMLSERLYAELALKAGAHGYLMKGEAPETMLEAIRTIRGGDVHLSDAIQAQWLRRTAGARGGDARLPIETLTPRELGILRLLGMGHGARRIAEDLSLSVKTVETHRDNIRNKLGLDTAADVLQYAALWLEHAARGEG